MALFYSDFSFFLGVSTFSSEDSLVVVSSFFSSLVLEGVGCSSDGLVSELGVVASG